MRSIYVELISSCGRRTVENFQAAMQRVPPNSKLKSALKVTMKQHLQAYASETGTLRKDMLEVFSTQSKAFLSTQDAKASDRAFDRSLDYSYENEKLKSSMLRL